MAVWHACKTAYALLLLAILVDGSSENECISSTSPGASLMQSASLHGNIGATKVTEGNLDSVDAHNQHRNSTQTPSGEVSARTEKAEQSVVDSFAGLQGRVASLLQKAASLEVGLGATGSNAGSFPIVLLLIMLCTLAVCFCVTRPMAQATSKTQGGFQPDLAAVVRNPNPRNSNTPPRSSMAPAPREFPSAGGRQSQSRDISTESEGDARRSTAGADPQFCPDLVVPEQCECILVVPVYAPAGAFNICDMNGRAVLHANTHPPGRGGGWSLNVKTATGEVLANCIEVGRPGSCDEFRILDAKGAFFASLVQLHSQQRFVLTTRSGYKLHLWGNFQTQAVNITDEDGGLVATTEPCGIDLDQTGAYYRLRVAPLVNVGHSLCALFCIGQVLRANK